MAEFITLGYVLSPARPPIIQAALLEDMVGEVSVGDLIAIPIILDEEQMYILGNVLSIEVRRPLLDRNSKAPYSLSRGDTMNLFEDVDVLDIADLEDVAYIASIYVHTFIYKNEKYPVHVVIPGSKIVKPPKHILESLVASGEIEIGKVRGENVPIKISEKCIFHRNLAILGSEEEKLKVLDKIVKHFEDRMPIFYLGRGMEDRDTLPNNTTPESGKRKVDNLKNLARVLNEIDKGVVIVEDYKKQAAGLVLGPTPIVPYMSNPKTARILLGYSEHGYLTSVLKLTSSLIIFGPITLETHKQYIRMNALHGIGEGEFYVTGCLTEVPVVGTIK